MESMSEPQGMEPTISRGIVPSSASGALPPDLESAVTKMNASAPTEYAVDSRPFESLIQAFNIERDESARALAKARKSANAVITNYEAEPGVGGTTNQDIYPGFSGKANSIMSDLIGLICPPGEPIRFNVVPFGPDGRQDAQVGMALGNEIERLLRIANFDQIRHVQVHNYFFHGNDFLVGPILNESAQVGWKVQPGVNGGIPSVVRSDTPDPLLLEFEQPDPRVCFPDTSVRKHSDIQFFHHRRVISVESLRRLMDVAVEKPELGLVVEELQQAILDTPIWDSLGAWDSQSAQEGAVQVWERLGFLSTKQIQVVQSGLKMKDAEKYLPGVCYRIWYTNRNRILRVTAVAVNPSRIPVVWSQAIPYPSRPLIGMPVGEALTRLWDCLTRTYRSIQDQLEDIAAVHALIDPIRVHNTDMSLKGRKVWLSRRDPMDIEGRYEQRDPVKFMEVPSRIGDLMALLERFEAKADVVTGVPQFSQNPADMGSGVRTVGQAQMIWRGTLKVIKWFVARVDKTSDEPVVNLVLDWIAYTQPVLFGQVSRVHVEAQGVQGAIEREVVPQMLLEAMERTGNVPSIQEWFDEIGIASSIVAGMIPRGVKALKTPAEYANFKMLQAKIAQQQATEQEEVKGGYNLQVEKERAASSARDVLAGLTREALKNPVAIDMLPALMEQSLEHVGAMSPRVSASLTALQQRVLMEQSRSGVSLTPAQSEALRGPFVAEHPGEMERGVPEIQAEQMVDPFGGQSQPQMPGAPQMPIAPQVPAAPVDEQAQLTPEMMGGMLPVEGEMP